MVRPDKPRFTLGALVCCLALFSMGTASTFFLSPEKDQRADLVRSKQNSGSLVPMQGSADSLQGRQKKLKEIAWERDVEVEGGSGCDLNYTTLSTLEADSPAIVYGRIISSKSFFDESSPAESGENITTEYTVKVLRISKDRTLVETMPPPGKPGPLPLATPLKIARNGGAVEVNGHRASVKVKGYDSLVRGKQYVFFLHWSPDYGAYVLTDCIFGAVLVNDDLSLKSLGSSKEFQAELSEMNLERLLSEISRP